MNTKTVQASTLQTTIISALLIAGIDSLPAQSNANDSWSIGGNSFSLILAQNEGGFFKRLAAKNRAKQAQRHTYNAPRPSSSQPVQPTSNLNQWNPFHNPRPQSSQTAQPTFNFNEWNPFHNPRPQSNEPARQTSNLNQWNPFHNPRPQSNEPTQQTSNLNQWNPFHNPRPQSNQPVQPPQPSNPNAWNPFQNQPNQNTQTPNNAVSRGLTNAERTSLVNYHNRVRSEVGVGPLRWSGQIAAHAQQWADEIARTGNFRHRQSNPYGENLAQGTAGFYTVVKLAEMWYDEKRFYTPGRPFSNSDMRAGHYTQMVWRGSTQMGAGKAIITSGRNKGNVVLVCNYAQRGNMIGQRPF